MKMANSEIALRPTPHMTEVVGSAVRRGYKKGEFSTPPQNRYRILLLVTVSHVVKTLIGTSSVSSCSGNFIAQLILVGLNCSNVSRKSVNLLGKSVNLLRKSIGVSATNKRSTQYSSA